MDHFSEEPACRAGLCLGCFKKRLWREFTREYFVPCVLNYFVNPIVRDIINPTEEERIQLWKKNK
ncbi:hypothetical protein EGN73_02180 [Arthrospiribacter ruber]|uniref:Uncharacterized protein n=1 Tax=Arthrospiribacter ruber TaxID=2487934 RepID=A0A951IW09_9BACT|nr:hypothetical protein [Arthrospiribacter ruber]